MAPPAFYKLVTVGAGLAGLGGLQSILLVPSHGLLDANLEKRPKFQAIDLITLSLHLLQNPSHLLPSSVDC